MNNKYNNTVETLPQTPKEPNQWDVLSEMPSFENKDQPSAAPALNESSELMKDQNTSPLSSENEIDEYHNSLLKSNETSPSEENQDINSYEVLINTNRDAFNKKTRRLALIAHKFPDIQNAPQSIQDEYLKLGVTRGRLLGFGGQGAGMRIAKDGNIVSQFKLQDYNDDIDKLAKLHEENASFISAEDEEQFELPKVDLESLNADAEEMGNDFYQLQNLDKKLEEAEKVADIDTVQQLDQIRENAEQKWTEEVDKAEQAELKQLQAGLNEAEEKLRQASANYHQLGAFRKAWKAFRGSDDRDRLTAEVDMAEHAIDSFKKQMGSHHPAKPNRNNKAESESTSLEYDASAQISPDKTERNLNKPESKNMIDTNRFKFNELTHRLAFIDNKFPSPEDTPPSIDRERSVLSYLRNQLLGIFVDKAGVSTASDGMLISKFHLQNYNDTIKELTQLQQTNQEFINEQEVKGFRSPEIDFDWIGLDAVNVGSDYRKLANVQSKISKAERHADIDSLLKLDKIDKMAVQIWTEATDVAEQFEFKQLQANLTEAEAKLRQANESYQKLGAFRRAWKAFRGSDNREQLATDVSHARHAITNFKDRTER